MSSCACDSTREMTIGKWFVACCVVIVAFVCMYVWVVWVRGGGVCAVYGARGRRDLVQSQWVQFVDRVHPLSQPPCPLHPIRARYYFAIEWNGQGRSGGVEGLNG